LSWVGGTVDGSGVVLRASGFSPSKISTYPVEYAFSQYATIEDAIGDSYEDLGHSFYLMTFPTADVTWAVDPDLGTLGWHKRGTWIAENAEYVAWRPAFHALAFGQHRWLDFGSGAVYAASSSYGYDVESRPLRWLRRAPSLVALNDRIWYGAFELYMETGLGTVTGQGVDPQVFLRMSNDGGKTWGNEQHASAGALGQYDTRVRFNRCGMARKRVFEISGSDPIEWRLLNAFVDVNQIPRAQQQRGNAA
jgi:hypothetical protein